MAKSPDLDKILETTLARVTEWLKFAETKNAALLAFCSAIVTTVSSRISNLEYSDLRVGLYILLVTSICSGIIAVMSFLPILERAFFYLAIMKERPSSNLLFFADIARHTPTDYRAKIAAAYDADSESMTVFTADLADQVVRVSRIGVRKFWMFNIAAIPLLIALIAAAVLMVFPRS